MSRKAYRITYTIGEGNALAQSQFYGETREAAIDYATALFSDLDGGWVEVEEVNSIDVGVPDDDELRSWAEGGAGALSPEAVENMRVPGVNG